MEILTQAAQLILSLSILVVLHELGHFIPAKLFKTRVEKFYLFFDPYFSLFKIKKGETEYGIGWLPLGGYVKIAGMIDESMDKEQMKLPPEPWEFRSKPTWQRLIIMVGGVTVNVILGIFIYSMILFAWGDDYLPTANVKYGIACDSVALSMGFQNGDKILTVDHKQIENFAKIQYEIIFNNPKTIQINRGGQLIDIPVKEEVLAQLIKGKSTLFEPLFPCEIDSVMNSSAASEAGLLKGDKIIALNDSSTPYFQDFRKLLIKNKNKQVVVKISRNGEMKDITAKISPEGTLGFYPKTLDKYFTLSTKEYGFFESFPAGIKKGYDTFDGYVKGLKMMFTVKDAHKSMGGFISIGKQYSTHWDWPRFWNFTAFLSIVLAIMNILPIPALDGGHVMFLLYEMITGRKPNEKILEYAQYVGMILLFSLLLYANGNDIVRIFSK